MTLMLATPAAPAQPNNHACLGEDIRTYAQRGSIVSGLATTTDDLEGGDPGQDPFRPVIYSTTFSTTSYNDDRLTKTMIILGIILILLVLFLELPPILYTIGIILVIVGAVLSILGAMGRAVGGRRYYW